MSPTPFLGLSVLIHLGIIFINRMLGRNGPIKRVRLKINKPSVSRRISMAIITSVLTVVSISAALLIDTAVVDKHSSIRFINHIIAQDLNHDTINNSNNIYSPLNYKI